MVAPLKTQADIPPPRSFTLLKFPSSGVKVGGLLHRTWGEFMRDMQLSGHTLVADKLDAPLLSPWSPRPGSTGRKTADVGAMEMIVFDLDKIDTTDVDEVLGWFSPFTALVHTTYSHGVSGKGCFRAYLRLARPVATEHYKAIHSTLREQLRDLDARVDKTSAQPSRCYFVPSCPPERKSLARVKWRLGAAVDPDALLNTTTVTLVPSKVVVPRATKIEGLMPRPTTEGERNTKLASAVGRAYAVGQEPIDVLPLALEWGERCNPPMDAQEVNAVVKSMWKTHTRNSAAATAVVHAKLADQPISEEEARPTDVWLAGQFVTNSSGQFRFDHSSKHWRIYRAGSWAPCSKGEHIEAMKVLAGALLQQAGELLKADPENQKTKKLLACAQRAQSVQGIDAALKLAQSDPAIAVEAGNFDTAPNLFNANTGVIDLSTGSLLPHDPAQMLCRQSPVAYDRNATCPMFMQFMNAVSRGDPDWVEFMQRALGYALSGYVSEEKLFFWLGKGANGKSVLANVLRHVMGTYAATVPPAFMMQSRRDGGGATPELAMLVGVRVALANEVEAGSRLSAQTVKVAVSTEHVTARRLYGDPFTFAPTHKLLIRGNHRPIITDDDEGIWRRILLVPFDLDVAPSDRDGGLEARLLTEAPGVLRWMVEGFAKWRKDGLRPAKRVLDASLAYRQESDMLLQWTTERCDTDADYRVPQSIAYANYRAWCQEQGLRYYAKASFTRGLTERRFGEGREGGGLRQHLYTGLRLKGAR